MPCRLLNLEPRCSRWVQKGHHQVLRNGLAVQAGDAHNRCRTLSPKNNLGSKAKESTRTLQATEVIVIAMVKIIVIHSIQYQFFAQVLQWLHLFVSAILVLLTAESGLPPDSVLP